MFPDHKEASLARRSAGWGDDLPFTLTSIPGALHAPHDQRPSLIIAVNPGFNIPEWIDLPKLKNGVPMIVVNGNIDRLRNGYYPSFFYPGLAKVTKEFYSNFTPALFLSPVAVGGDRFGAWLAKKYDSDWELLVKSVNSRPITYDVIQSTKNCPDAPSVWKTAKERYIKDRGISQWGI